LGLGDAIAVAEALDGAMAWLGTGNFKLFKSELLISNVPSLPSTRAQHVPSLF
jgi:hypothetical protein